MASKPNNLRRTPKEILALFGKILKESEKFYGLPGYKVGAGQWKYVAASRLSEPSFRFLGTYATLREYFSPSPDAKKQLNVGLSAIQRIIKNAKAA